MERELADKPAGFRTHMLVAGAAAPLVGLGDALIHRFDASGMGESLRSDPIRIVGPSSRASVFSALALSFAALTRRSMWKG